MSIMCAFVSNNTVTYDDDDVIHFHRFLVAEFLLAKVQGLNVLRWWGSQTWGEDADAEKSPWPDGATSLFDLQHAPEAVI